MFIDKINIKALKRQNNFDFYRKHVVQHIKILVYTCKLHYLCINKSNEITHFKNLKSYDKHNISRNREKR